MQIFQFAFSVWVLFIFYLLTEFPKRFAVQKTALIGSYPFYDLPICGGRGLEKNASG